jgi:NAD-dependent dihydropyrimidine dehydrogenase PreA subunit
VSRPTADDLRRTEGEKVTYVIAEPCVDVKDRACLTECPVDCIYEGGRTLYINPAECVDCHACEPVCPVEAIFYEEDVPQHWAQYTTINAEYFETSSGQQSEPYVVEGDHRLIAQLPPRSSHKKDIAVFSIRKEEAADADLWFPS